MIQEDKSVEIISRLRVLVSTDQLTTHELHENTHPMIMNELIHDYSLFEADIIAQIPPSTPIKVAISAQIPENNCTDTGNAKSSAREEENVTKWLEEVFYDASSESRLEKSPVVEEGDNEDETEASVIEKILSHRVNN